MVPVHFSRLIAREIGLRENTLKGLLKGTDISPRAFLESDILLTTDQQTTVAINAMAISGDRGVGLKMGNLLSQGAYGPLGYLLNNSQNLQIVLENYRKFLPDYVPFAHLVFRSEDDHLVCIFDMKYAENEDLYRAAVESISLSLLGIARSVVGDQLSGCEMYCRYPRPDYAERYAIFYGIPVYFDAPESNLRIPASLLSVANPVANRANYTLAEMQCRKMAKQFAIQQSSVANRVKEALVSNMPGALSEQDVARQLFVSRRTLSRRLAAEGTSFRQLREEIYAVIAARHLLETDDTVESIALILHYHDGSNFRRAFKKWFGVTPDTFRATKGRTGGG
jgi:AraC-like DNA-binding protein